MTGNKQEFIYKGGDFVNRYRITATLTTLSPLHIGSGTRRPDDRSEESKKKTASPAADDKTNDKPKDETVDVDEVVRDARGWPYIPGSSLRGVVRHYLLQIFRGYNPKIAKEEDYESDDFRKKEQKEAMQYLETKASMLERLFGTPFSESKVEFWDAGLKQEINAPPEFAPKGWNQDWQTYPVRSVAIDPATGAAEAHKLYNFDVVPTGAQFEANIVGQNLTDAELGLLFFGLFGFNSEIYPLTLGAMAGRGFGRLRFKVDRIYRLTSAEIENWINVALNQEHAGFKLFEHLKPEASEALLRQFKDALFTVYKPREKK